MQVNNENKILEFKKSPEPTPFDKLPREITQCIFFEASNAKKPCNRLLQLAYFSSVSQKIREILSPLNSAKFLIEQCQQQREPLPKLPYEKLLSTIEEYGKAIVFLDLGKNSYNEQGIITLLGHCTNLKALNLGSTKVTPAMLAKFEGIENLTINQGTFDENLGIAIGKMDQLEFLEITGRISDIEGIYSLSNLKSLKVILLNGTFSSKSFNSKSCLEELQVSDVSDLLSLEEYPKLRLLRLTSIWSVFSDQKLDEIPEKVPLEELQVSCCSDLTNEGFMKLKKFKSLHTLIVDNVPEDLNLEFVKVMPNLQHLGIFGSGVSASDLEPLKKSRTLRTVHIQTNQPISEEERNSVVRNSKSLTSIGLTKFF